MKGNSGSLNAKKGILAFFKSKKGINAVVAIGLIGMLLIFLSTLFPGRDKPVEKGLKASMTAEEFVSKTEKKLSQIIRSIEGAGECRVMVTLENGVEYVYAREQDINTDRKEDDSGKSERDGKRESIIIVDTENGRQGLLVTEIQPTVKGVVVVCQGGDDPVVQERIASLVTTALNISSKRVCVTKLSD
ncbi:MAG TPA: stage III sporulation protein AG [Candidatus Avimonas sp.]|jgi:stage III sporulation protein AG|nr:stage III sporulation protein AG [Clostridiales bacterium]HOB36530.1 stage III sporulation protein AG [Candidatus Avimonas sp.]HQA15717.1 stage III sporulation protein AG [Candidatus Avimonas sp.]HQD38647.1 stage III sporulation protein AG [Candidatus Avimonas sp.]